jgi:hypothetical protein
MIPVALKKLNCPYSVARVTKASPDKFIYSVPIDNQMYFISKSVGADDCAQIDGHLALDTLIFHELCEVLKGIERDCHKRRSLDIINREILNVFHKIRGLRLQEV